MAGVALALGASLSWGISDFLGGMSARRAGALAVTLLTQVAGVALAAGWTAVSGDAPPDAHGFLLALGAGAGVVVGLGAFYKALALGFMSIVAPLTSTGVIVPVLAGVIGGERPTGLQLAGIALATAGVACAARRPGRLVAARRDASASVALALVAAGGSGVFMWLMAPASRESLPWALLVARGTAAPALALLVLARGARLRPALAPWSVAVAIAAVAVLGFSASALYAASTRYGLLSLVAVCASLYPAVTVLLARAWLGERLDRGRTLGVAAVLAGVVLMAS